MFSFPPPFLETIFYFRDTVILNVGGMIHQVKWETIEKFPKSRLHNLRFAVTEGKREKIGWKNIERKYVYLDEIISICDSYSLTNREFFFDRSPRVFEYILGIYRKGELHLPSSVCPRDFLGELEYWGLSALHLGGFAKYLSFCQDLIFSEPCCAYTLQRATWELPSEDKSDLETQVRKFVCFCFPHYVIM